MNTIELLKWESIISKIRATDSKGEYRLDYWSAQKLIEEFAEQHAEAAALIEDYGRRVPRAFVEEILDKAWNCLTDRPEGMVLQTIADKYGVKVEDAE